MACTLPQHCSGWDRVIDKRIVKRKGGKSATHYLIKFFDSNKPPEWFRHELVPFAMRRTLLSPPILDENASTDEEEQPLLRHRVALIVCTAHRA